MKVTEAIEYQWPYILSFLPNPESIEQLALSTGAIRRRRRIESADILLRLAFVYAFCGYSLRQTAAWAEAAGVAEVSDVALLKRFRTAADWICALIGSVLASQVDVPRVPAGSFSRIRLVDGTTISEPGSAGSDWRVHLGFDVGTHRIVSLELTSANAGESLTRVHPMKNELLIADRGYAHARGFRHVLDHGAHFLVRLPWKGLTLVDESGADFDVLGWVRTIPEAAAAEVEIHLRDSAAPLRLVAIRKTEPAAAAARRKILNRATNHTKHTDPRTLEAAGFTILLTSIAASELSAEAALALYRFRWQIELSFKNLKSIGTLDKLPAKDPDLARMILATKLLGALLIEQLTSRYVSFSPWGYPLRQPSTQ